MKLKLTPEEASILMIELRDAGIYGTEYEFKITQAISKKFILKLMKKLMDKPEKLTIDMDDATVLAIYHVLNGVTPEHEYNQILIWEINSKLHKWLVNS